MIAVMGRIGWNFFSVINIEISNKKRRNAVDGRIHAQLTINNNQININNHNNDINRAISADLNNHNLANQRHDHNGNVPSY